MESDELSSLHANPLKMVPRDDSHARRKQAGYLKARMYGRRTRMDLQSNNDSHKSFPTQNMEFMKQSPTHSSTTSDGYEVKIQFLSRQNMGQEGVGNSLGQGIGTKRKPQPMLNFSFIRRPLLQ